MTLEKKLNNDDGFSKSMVCQRKITKEVYNVAAKYKLYN